MATSSDKAISDTYDVLRRIAAAYFRSQPASHTLQPTALVHEAFLRLAQTNEFESREHFMAVAATAMRQVLASHARKAHSLKRGGALKRVPLAGAQLSVGSSVDLLAVDDALAELERLSPRQARIVTFRFFGGLTFPEIASTMDVSLSTVEKEWRRARAWLAAEFS